MASTLITPSGLIPIIDALGKEFNLGASTIDAMQAQAQSIAAVITTSLPGDYAQQFQWFQFVNGITQAAGVIASAAGTPVPNPFGSGGAGGFAGGASFGTGSGAISRVAFFSSFQAALDGPKKLIRAYAAAAGLSAIQDLGSYANYYNNPANPGGAVNTIYYTPDTACLYWYVYGRGQAVAVASAYALPAATVFAPAGIVLAYHKITGAGTGTLTPGTFPVTNGYSTPCPTGGLVGTIAITGLATATLTAGPVSVGNNALAYCPSTITGTATLTLTAPNQNAVSRTFVAVVSNAAAGALIAFVPTTPGDVIGGAPTAIAVAGTATTGTIQVVSGLPPADAYGNLQYIGGLPLAQGFCPLKTAQVHIVTSITGTGAITVHALNQAGVAATWTATLTGLTAGGNIDLTPTNAGDRIYGNITAIDVAAGLTAGSFQVLSKVERTY